MYFFIPLIVIAIIFIVIAIRSQSKLKKEKAEGKWDFILDEFIPYIESHSEPVKTTDELSFVSYDGSGTANFKGKLHYNKAGILVEKSGNSDSPKIIEFFRGRDEPSKFKPLFESSLYNIQKHDERIRLNLKTSSTNCRELTINQVPENLFEEIKDVLGELK